MAVNTDVLEGFSSDLDQYERVAKPTGSLSRNFHAPTNHMKRALRRVVDSDADTTTAMMEHLVERIKEKTDTLYSEYTIEMMIDCANDLRSRQIIVAILIMAREVVLGNKPDFNEAWLKQINNNTAVLNFLNDYNAPYPPQEHSYSGIPQGQPRRYVLIEDSNLDITLKIGDGNYDVVLTDTVLQHVNLVLDTDADVLGKADPNRPDIVVTDLILTSHLAAVYLHRDVRFYDDAWAQLQAFKCVPPTRQTRTHTLIKLPDSFYSIALNCVSMDKGKTWFVTEANVLPPSEMRINRHKYS